MYLGGIIKLYKMKLQSSNKVESAPRLLNRQMRHALRMVTVLETQPENGKKGNEMERIVYDKDELNKVFFENNKLEIMKMVSKAIVDAIDTDEIKEAIVETILENIDQSDIESEIEESITNQIDVDEIKEELIEELLKQIKNIRR